MKIYKPGKTKQQLLECLGRLQTKFQNEVREFDIKVTPIEDGYNVHGEKKIVFINIVADINITAEDQNFNINYDTKNVPQSKINEAIDRIRDVLEKC